MFKSEKKNLTKEIKEFKRNRFLRKMWQQISRFFWSLLFVGVFIGNSVSQGAKHFLATNWVWLILAYVIWQTAKEYIINQILKQKRLKLQKNHLLASCLELYSAHLATIILGGSLEESVREYRAKSGAI